MKTTFTVEEFDLFTKEITDKGYIKCNGKLRNEDYYFYKSIFKTLNEDGNSRAVVQLILSIYDWRKYILHDVKDIFSAQFNIEISRNNNERNSIILDTNLFESIEDAEKITLDLYKYFETKLPYKNYEKNI